MKLDLIVFAVHPDDAELSCGGILLTEKMKGKKTGVIDLTEGELGTRGTVATRKKEATESAKILQLDVRENLQMADGFFKNDEANQRKVITALRKYRPEIIFCNAPEDRHPDHGRSARLVEDAAFLAGLRKIETENDGVLQEVWRPKYVFNFIQDKYLSPSFVIDISDVMDKKIESIMAYTSQSTNNDSSEPETYISSPDFVESVIYRSKMFGKMIGVRYAEGFISKKMIGFNSFDALIKENT